MGLYRIKGESIEAVGGTQFATHGVRERDHIQRMVGASIGLVAPGTMVLAEEYSDWSDSDRRIDLLCLDEDANLVVVELKRGSTGGHMELQAIRYAAMVSAMTFERAVAAHARYLAQHGEDDAEAEQRILEFLGWDEPDEDRFGRDVRITLVSADFSTEITTAALWLAERGIDIRCVRMRPYALEDELLVSIEQVLPLPTAEEYRVRLKEKTATLRAERAAARKATGYFFANTGEDENTRGTRSWELCRRYGYVSAGGGPRWVASINRLSVGDRVLVYRTGKGYVGAGVVTEPAVRRHGFVPEGESRTLSDMLAAGGELDLAAERAKPDDQAEWCARVRWVKTLEGDRAVPGQAQRHAVCQLRDIEVVRDVLQSLGVLESDWDE